MNEPAFPYDVFLSWDEIPCRTTEVLFKRLKEEIIRLKDEGRVLMRFSELRETLQLRLSGEFKRFAVSQPGRASDNSPAIHRWVPGREGIESRQGRKSGS